jgi:hypothetical protein
MRMNSLVVYINYCIQIIEPQLEVLMYCHVKLPSSLTSILYFFVLIHHHQNLHI